MDDFLCDFDNVDECFKAINEKIMIDFIPNYGEEKEYIEYQWSCSWSHIYDTVD